ncbi:MAG: Ig-like domain-containing protein [Mediterranea sp.]|nr:Ig-like domain-containing protein [Mediterranea sp.]
MALPVILLASCSDDKKSEPPAPVVVEVATVQLSRSTVYIEQGKKATLAATIAPDKTLEWSSANASIAEVDAKGTVSAKALGTTTITATASNGVKGTATVTVFDPTDIPIPDAKFKASLLNQITHAHPDKISLEEAKAVPGINCASQGIESLEGIQFFENLEMLYCGDNVLTNLDVSSLTKLKLLYCEDNKLTNLDVSSLTNLEILNCQHNRLTRLDVSSLTKLMFLACGDNSLDEVIFGEASNLMQFQIYGDVFSKLDISGLTELKGLFILENHSLTELTLDNLPKLEYLSFENTVLAKLDLSGLTGLNFLTCRNNSLLTELWFQDKAQRDRVSLNIDSEDIIRYHNE